MVANGHFPAGLTSQTAKTPACHIKFVVRSFFIICNFNERHVSIRLYDISQKLQEKTDNKKCQRGI